MDRLLSFKAKNNVDLGRQLGEFFGDRLRAKLVHARRGKTWEQKKKIAARHWAVSRRHFPMYADELVAYARAAGVPWQELWTLSLEINIDAERCTSMVTNGGLLVGHVEDFDPSSVDDLYLIRKTIGRTTVLDLNYFYTLGGNAASINAHGWAQLINTLHGPVSASGIPRNVIARWLSETRDPERDARKLAKLPRMDGYGHTFVNAEGHTLSLETDAAGLELTQADFPFAHTNHYLSGLVKQQRYVSQSSLARHEVATKRLSGRMTVPALKQVMADTSRGKAKSISNEDTIGKMIIDFKKREAQVWFKAAPRKGYTLVSLDFLP